MQHLSAKAFAKSQSHLISDPRTNLTPTPNQKFHPRILTRWLFGNAFYVFSHLLSFWYKMVKKRVLKDKVEEACRCELGAQQVKQPQCPVEVNWEILCNEAEPRSRLEVWCRWSSRCSAGHKQDFGGRVG